MDDALIRDVLTRTRTIALVGYSANPDRPSHRVAHFLKSRGYRVIPVNPGLAGQEALGETVQPSLSEIEGDVDMVDIFRRSDAVPAVVDEALERWPSLGTVWMQLGITHDEAAAKAEAQGVTVIQNRCPAIEYPRLMG
ncbi:CoA-binding protein [Pelagovum pacificum]|uniref:CoA-binding protein n=1 Tax=Pelagovum pacificum TaxID=2588711 RepID=A0A5C5GFJ7_9RHOB|nr:CoA-binding protein [Pelagovum pacificum]QQA44024.1 CoA-binding protein [Pelagovum pacificum]TNY32847.1 CoA-binding protein [Pelagovum pacificum]